MQGQLEDMWIFPTPHPIAAHLHKVVKVKPRFITTKHYPVNSVHFTQSKGEVVPAL
jgi:hypothetical protein